MAKTAETVEMVAKWVCISIQERYSGGIHNQDIRNAISEALGSDLHELLFIGDDIGEGHYQNALDVYVFVKCTRLQSHKQALKQCKYIRTVLNSFSDIRYVDQTEIDALRDNWTTTQEARTTLCFGDVVRIKGGLFEHLHGIVTGKRDNDYEVVFRLCTGYRVAVLPSNNMTVQANVVQHVRFPLL